MKGFTRYLLIVAGTFFVGLGVLGVFIPVLPTTPFLLLAAVCYARSSERFYNWLMTNRWSGEYIRNYREDKGITLRHKVITISLLWITILISAWFFVPQWWVKIILIGIAAGVTLHLVRMKTLK